MANPVIGKNIMLYWKNPNGLYYLNGGISEGTISSNEYFQLSSTENVGNSANFTVTQNNVIARFITDTNQPNVTSIAAGTWSLSAYVSITTDLTSAPAFYYKISKFDGTTFTTIVTSTNVTLTSINKTLYVKTVSFPATTLASNERLVIEFYPVNVGTRNITLYTQGDNVTKITTTLAVDVPFACSTNCTFNVNVDQKEVTSQSSAWYREYKNDIANWQVTCDGLITISGFNYTNMLSLQQSRTPLNIEFVVDNGVDGLTVISGSCNLTSLQINAPYKDIATYSISLQGSGAYSITGTQAAGGGIIIRGGTVYNQQYTAVGGETTITFAAMVGKTCLYVSRGGIDVREILTTGTPTGDQVLWDTLSATLTFGRALEADEFIRGLFN